MTYLFYKKLLKKKGDVIMVMNSVENYRRKPVKITKDIVAYIIANKNTLIDKGVAKRVSNSCQCIECGKESDIYLTVKGDGSTSMCLNCAIGVALDKAIEINCTTSDGTGSSAGSTSGSTDNDVANGAANGTVRKMDCFS